MFTFGPYKHLTRPSLHPDLQRCLANGVLSHPLLSFDYIDHRHSARLNQLYEYRRGIKRRQTKEWDCLRPDLPPFARLIWYSGEIARVFEDAEVSVMPLDRHDQILGQIWTDPELISNTSDVFYTLYGYVQRPNPIVPNASIMIESERQFLAGLPDCIQVFRGHVPAIEHRPSWTLNPSVALAWSCRGEPGCESVKSTYSPEDYMFFAPIVTVGTVHKSRVIAYINRRDEDEILVMPDDVIDRNSYEVIRE